MDILFMIGTQLLVICFWVQQLVDLKCEWICMHAEVLDGLAFRLIDQIQDAGLKAGVVLNPETPIDTILPYIDLVDKALKDTIEIFNTIDLDDLKRNQEHFQLVFGKQRE